VLSLVRADPGGYRLTVSRRRGELETLVTLILADQAPALAEAHDELYPVRVREAIPLSLTLLYPFVPRDSLTDGHFTALQDLFAARSPFAFELTHVAEFPDIVMYAVPEPDDDLRATMRALWALFPDYPPYGRAGSDPPPHATLAQLDYDPDTVRNAVPKRVEGLLPARFDVREATLMEEHRPDRWRVRASFPFAG
jgi:2'-5' RNA ligase